MRACILCATAILLLTACSRPVEQNQTVTQPQPVAPQVPLAGIAKDSVYEYRPYYSLEGARVEEPEEQSKVYLVDKRCAVHVYPDTAWINEQQRSMSEDDWNTIVDDNQYYISLGIDTLRKLGVPIQADQRERRFIRFRKSNGTDFIIDLDRMKERWGLILFNGTDAPVYWSDTDIHVPLQEIYGFR